MKRVPLTSTAVRLEKLFIEVRNVWINMLAVPGMNTYGYDGELTGKIDYSGRNKNDLGVKMDIRQMKTYKSPIGDFRITASYLSDTLGTVRGDLNAILNDTSSLNLIFRSEMEGETKSMQTEFSDIPLKTFESLVSKFISGLTGEVSGELRLSSTGKKPMPRRGDTYRRCRDEDHTPQFQVLSAR